MASKRAETVDTLIYGGRAIMHFYTGNHRYKVSIPALDKWRVPQIGVTTVLGIKDKSAALQKWTADQCELYIQNKIAENPRSWFYNEDLVKFASEMKSQYRKTKAKAAEIGVVVHDHLHEVLLAKQNHTEGPPRPSLSETMDSTMLQQANNSIDAGLEFFESHRLVPLTMERPMWSARGGYVGTEDFIGLLDSELVCLDFKSSKYLYSEVFLQTMAYQNAYKEEFPDCGQFEANWGIHVAKTGKLNAVRRGKEYFESDLAAFFGAKTLYDWDRLESGSKPIEVIGSLDEVPVPIEEEEW